MRIQLLIKEETFYKPTHQPVCTATLFGFFLFAVLQRDRHCGTTFCSWGFGQASRLSTAFLSWLQHSGTFLSWAICRTYFSLYLSHLAFTQATLCKQRKKNPNLYFCIAGWVKAQRLYCFSESVSENMSKKNTDFPSCTYVVWIICCIDGTILVVALAFSLPSSFGSLWLCYFSLFYMYLRLVRVNCFYHSINRCLTVILQKVFIWTSSPCFCAKWR